MNLGQTDQVVAVPGTIGEALETDNAAKTRDQELADWRIGRERERLLLLGVQPCPLDLVPFSGWKDSIDGDLVS